MQNGNTSSPLNRGGILLYRYTFVKNTISNSLEVPRAIFLGSDGLFCFTSISKFAISNKIYSVRTNEKSDFYEP